MRMIDADLPMEQMEKLLDHHLMMGNFSADGAVSDCINFLKTAPTIDAVPAVHGRWKKRKKWTHMVCSVCSFEVPYDIFAYCPNCGAKMDEASE